MKKPVYVLIAIAPVLIGWLYNSRLASLGFLTFVLAFAMLGLWFWAGRKFARLKIRAIWAVLLGNSAGIISLAVYILQVAILSDQHRSIFLTALSQMFSAIISSVSAMLAMLFAPTGNNIDSEVFMSVQIIGLLLMIAVFAAGVVFERKRPKCEG